MYAFALLQARSALSGGKSLPWSLVLLGCSLGLTALIAQDHRRKKQGIAFWLVAAALLALSDGAALSILGALTGALVLAGAERFGEARPFEVAASRTTQR